MHDINNIVTNSADTTLAGSGNAILEGAAGVLSHTQLFMFLGARDTASFSGAWQAGGVMTSVVRKEQALKALLKAVVEGDEALAKKIVTSRPDLLLGKTAIVNDILGKVITGLTPLQAAICAGDVDMVQMIKEVLQQKIQSGVTLSFVPELEIQRQLTTIYPNGDIDANEAAQKATAQEFKTSTLKNLFIVINAATELQIKFELETPGQHTDSQLNAELHNFRTQFSTTANQELIFNPFRLLNAFEFYNEKFDNFRENANSDDEWNRRSIFWCQVIGFVQRHLPACYLQAFAQGIYYIVENNEPLERSFKFRYGGGFMKPVAGDLNNLGYKWAGAAGVGALVERAAGAPPHAGWLGQFSKIIANKKIRFGELTQPESQWQQLQSYLPTRCVIA